jgi:RNA polymerase sigma-70 factor, ECF subfamily
VQDELILLNRARALDQEALAQIHDTYYTAMYRYIAFRVGDHQTAEDLTSEVFMRLLGALRNRNAPQNTLRGWLYGVAARVVKEHYRQGSRARHVWLDETIPSPQSAPDMAVEAALAHEQLQAAMTELTEEQQNVIALRFGYEMPIQDVAETLGKTEGSVKMLQARALAALSRKLGRGKVN